MSKNILRQNFLALAIPASIIYIVAAFSFFMGAIVAGNMSDSPAFSQMLMKMGNLFGIPESFRDNFIGIVIQSVSMVLIVHSGIFAPGQRIRISGLFKTASQCGLLPAVCIDPRLLCRDSACGWHRNGSQRLENRKRLLVDDFLCRLTDWGRCRDLCEYLYPAVTGKTNRANQADNEKGGVGFSRPST